MSDSYTGAHAPLHNIVACNASSTQLQNFSNTQELLPNMSDSYTGAHAPLHNIVACNASSRQLQNFNNTQELLPKVFESIVEQSLPDVVVAELKKRLVQNKRTSALCL